MSADDEDHTHTHTHTHEKCTSVRASARADGLTDAAAGRVLEPPTARVYTELVVVILGGPTVGATDGALSYKRALLIERYQATRTQSIFDEGCPVATRCGRSATQ
jgi:hypothetical protein